MKPIGIIEKIRAAANETEISVLLGELNTYGEASPKTVRRAHRVAVRREKSLLKEGAK